jgi:hypothetical protein
LDVAPSQEVINKELAALLPRLPAVGSKQRLQHLLELYLDTPYLLSAIGDGPESEFDQFPLYRTDAFDCLSYSALVFVLLHATDLATLQALWQQLNYNAEISFLQRKHFMESDWLPGLCEINMARAITAQFASKKIDLKIDTAAWINKTTADKIRLLDASADDVSSKVQHLKKLATGIKPKNICFEYIAVHDCLANNFSELRARLPEYTFVAFADTGLNLRDKIGTDLAVTHCGVVRSHAGDLCLYHASSEHKKIVAVDFVDYCKARYKKSKSFCLAAFEVL